MDCIIRRVLDGQTDYFFAPGNFVTDPTDAYIYTRVEDAQENVKRLVRSDRINLRPTAIYKVVDAPEKINASDDRIEFAWLRAFGFTRHMQSAASNALSIYRSPTQRGPFINIELQRGGDWAIGISDGDVAVYLPAGLTPQTKTEFVHLCTAFGFPLVKKNDKSQDR